MMSKRSRERRAKAEPSKLPETGAVLDDPMPSMTDEIVPEMAHTPPTTEQIENDLAMAAEQGEAIRLATVGNELSRIDARLNELGDPRKEAEPMRLFAAELAESNAKAIAKLNEETAAAAADYDNKWRTHWSPRLIERKQLLEQRKALAAQLNG